MPEDQPRVVESLRSRPWRVAAISILAAASLVAAAVVRRQILRSESLQSWAAQSEVMAHLTGTNARAWIDAREADAKLLAAAAARTPQLFGVPRAPGEPAITPANVATSLTRRLASISQLHAYTAIWLFDRSGRIMGTTSTGAAPAAVRSAAMRTLAVDSGMVYGPFPTATESLSISFAEPVVLPGTVAPAGGDTSTSRVIGSVVLTSNAEPLLTELAAWSDRSTTGATSLVVGVADSVFEYGLAPERSRGVVRGAWARFSAPRFARAAFDVRPDTTAAIVGANAISSMRIDSVPWALTRREAAGAVFADVNDRLGTEVSTTAAVLFMIAIIVIARRQTVRERKLIEVSESEARYRLLADNATDVIIRHAPDGRIVYISPAVQAILGYQPRQLLGHYPSELFHEDDPTTMGGILELLRVTNGPARAEHRLRHADGHYVWVETTGRAVRDPIWSQVTELVTVSRDIEDRKRAEEALRASEEDYRVLFEGNPLPMWAFNPDTYRFVAVNDEAVSHYGYSREEFLAMTIFDIRPPSDAQLVRDRVEQVRTGLTDVHGVRHQKKDGSIMDVDLTVHEVQLSGGVTRVVLVKDMTDARRTETALRESTELIRALFDSSPVAIIATDLDLRVLQWNRAAERLFGWTADEVVGKEYPLATDAMYPDVQRIRDRALRDGTFIDIPAQRCRKDGSVVELSLSVGVIRNALSEPAGYVLLAADISERAKLETQLRHAQKMDAVGRLAGGIAHDFNNLLTVVTGYAGMLLAELPQDAPMRPDVQEIIGAADRAGVLTRQLLAFSRQQVLQPKVLDLNVVVRGMEHMLRRVLPANIKFVTALDPSIGAVNADPGQIEQVLMNLIVNARDAMPNGGTLTVETADINLTAAEGAGQNVASGDYTMLSVADTGCGMTKSVQARIFEPFFTTKGHGEGNGLGLPTAHGIVTQSGGCLTVDSEPGLGTTIRMCLPRVPFVSSAATEPAAPHLAATRGAEVILLVEDDPAVRATTARILERAGYTVLVACDGNEALAIHAKHGSRIDLLVTDMVMPEMSGRELAALVRARDPNVAVLVMSGYIESTSNNQGFADAGGVFINKPFSPDALIEKVRNAINAATVDASA